eukprot:s2004_g19.t1
MEIGWRSLPGRHPTSRRHGRCYRHASDRDNFLLHHSVLSLEMDRAGEAQSGVLKDSLVDGDEEEALDARESFRGRKRRPTVPSSWRSQAARGEWHRITGPKSKVLLLENNRGFLSHVHGPESLGGAQLCEAV